MTIQAYAPGRTELAGNHTDHQGGRVIAAAVSCGVQVELTPNASSIAHVESEGFAPVMVDLSETEPFEDERFTTASLVRGVIAGLQAQGVDVPGFDVNVSSTVPAGGGLSSSAAFELALAVALLEAASGTSDVQLDAVQLARIGQAAERDYFGKPCGLMDQLAVALGGVAAIDFKNEEAPEIEHILFDFEQHGLALCLIDTHCDHSLYTKEYAQVARDMDDVAALMGVHVLSQVSERDFLDQLSVVREKLGDAPAMRALHYYRENRLVDARVKALREGDAKAFLDYTRRSGASSAQYLQNVSTFDRVSQPAMAVLALADTLLNEEGACRIHGGGFGGSVQAFVPLDRVGYFTAEIDKHVGEGSCRAYRVDSHGARVNLVRE